MFDIIFSSFPLYPFHPFPFILSIIPLLSSRFFFHLASLSVFLEITPSPFTPTCYHIHCHQSSACLFPKAHPLPYTHLFKFLPHFTSPYSFSCSSHLFGSVIHLLILLLCFLDPSALCLLHGPSPLPVFPTTSSHLSLPHRSSLPLSFNSFL